MTFSGEVENGLRSNRFDFGGEVDQSLDPGYF